MNMEVIHERIQIYKKKNEESERHKHQYIWEELTFVDNSSTTDS